MDTRALRRQLRARRDLPSPEQRRAIRTAAGLSQGAIAKAVGVTAQAVSTWETGRRDPSGELLGRYARVLELIREEMAGNAA